MKKIYIIAMAATMAATAFAQSKLVPQAELTNKYGFIVKSKGHVYKTDGTKSKIMPLAQETPYDILACKQGSVFGNEYTEETAWTGSATADAGRPNLAMEYYQHFDDCSYKFDEVRFIGFFNYYDGEDWIYCHDRGAMDDNMEMTKPVTFTIGVYEEGEDGLPGRCVMQKDIDIIANKTNVALESYGNSGSTNLYEFCAPLGQTIDLEHGFIQINAKDMGDSPSCWFALFTVGGNTFAYQKDVVNEEYSGQLACAYCLYGDGSFNAKKALQIERFLSPKPNASGKYEKVQVEISNIGENAINDAKLALYVDDKLVATEDVDATIETFESYKHTFNTRVDCSDGKHTITVKNVTPGDEKKAYTEMSISVEATVTSEYPNCAAILPNVINITNVSLGTINNTSEGSKYSDYTSQKTTFRENESQELNVTISSIGTEPSLGVFIDWNGDYKFSGDEAVKFDSFEKNSNGGQATATITMPNTAKIGEHRMRVVTQPYYDLPEPSDNFYKGEAEDYTIVIEPSQNAPRAEVDKTFIEQKTNSSAAKSELTIANNGTKILETTVGFNYVLPNAPTSRYSAKVAPKTGFKGQLKAARMKTAASKAPEKDATTQYVLKYDGDNYECIGIGNASSAIFASLYPGAMLSSIQGMKISSVDVYIGDLPNSASIVIYGEKKQTECGNLIAEKTFTPTEHSWNRVVLDKPVEIGTTDLWIGVKMNDINADGYYIGIDEGPAITGFGDMVNIGGDYWWSMSDLGLDYNYCIRANVTGNRTPAINWLSTDKSNINVAAGTSEKLGVNFAPQGLDDGLYEAYIEISTNDNFNSFIRIPVYMINGQLSAIGSVENQNIKVELNGDKLTIKGEKTIANISVNDMSGRCVTAVKNNSNEASVSLDNVGKGVYIVSATYTDGKKVSIKIPVLK